MFTVSAITMRKDPIYLSTFTGRPPDEPSVLGEALNDVFVPLLRQQFPEIVDFWLPPEGCSYRVAVVSIRKAYPGHARRIMMGVWSYLRQFMYTKFVIVVDDDIDCRDWNDVIWAISTRVDPGRDLMVVEHTPIDYLDFASPESGLGGKLGMDATDKWPPETKREWGTEAADGGRDRREGDRKMVPAMDCRDRVDRSGSEQMSRRARAPTGIDRHPTWQILSSIAEYDPSWPERFRYLAGRIAAALADLAMTIEHVGSTAVPGLAAKPIIDLDVVVRAEDLSRATAILRTLGYVHEGDRGIAGREAAGRHTRSGTLYVCPPDILHCASTCCSAITCEPIPTRPAPTRI